MNPFVIEIQQNVKDNVFNFVVRDSRSGIIKSCGYDPNELISFIESLNKK